MLKVSNFVSLLAAPVLVEYLPLTVPGGVLAAVLAGLWVWAYMQSAKEAEALVAPAEATEARLVTQAED
jgi:hypothetical protein